MTRRIQEISQLDRLIHEPARLTIMMILYEAGEADFLYLQREGGFTQGNLSGHLAKLEDAGYVEIEKKFKGKVPLTVCRLTGKGKAAFAGYARKMREFSTTPSRRSRSRVFSPSLSLMVRRWSWWRPYRPAWRCAFPSPGRRACPRVTVSTRRSSSHAALAVAGWPSTVTFCSAPSVVSSKVSSAVLPSIRVTLIFGSCCSILRTVFLAAERLRCGSAADPASRCP